jgi:predicted enzyme related to lactoylglutathione lyase
MTSGARTAGDFCWINVLTAQYDESREFFASLLGWTYADLYGMGHVILSDGHPFGGMFNLEAPNTPPGATAGISIAILVDDVDAACAKVNSLGGSAKPPFDIMDAGRFGECKDPTGAHFDLWQPKKMGATDIDTMSFGAPCWYETMTTDAKTAGQFYKDLLGWTSNDRQMPGMVYTTFSHNGRDIGGMFQITPEMGAIPSNWAVYFTVTDADESLRKALELGATQCMPVTDVPGVGRFTMVSSPQDIKFYVFQHPR